MAGGECNDDAHQRPSARPLIYGGERDGVRLPPASARRSTADLCPSLPASRLPTSQPLFGRRAHQ